MERLTGSFRRSLRLPSDAQQQNVTAKFENGVLCIEIPKLPEAERKQGTVQIQ